MHEQQGTKSNNLSDWERVVIAYKKELGQWFPSSLLMSSHGGYTNRYWSNIEQTLKYASSQ